MLIISDTAVIGFPLTDILISLIEV
jgi:hypothetical protein